MKRTPPEEGSSTLPSWSAWIFSTLLLSLAPLLVIQNKALVLVLVVSLLVLIANRPDRALSWVGKRPRGEVFAVLALGAWGVASSIWSTDAFISLQMSLRTTVLLSLVIAVVLLPLPYRDRSAVLAAKMIVIGYCIAAAMVIFEIFTGAAGHQLFLGLRSDAAFEQLGWGFVGLSVLLAPVLWAARLQWGLWAAAVVAVMAGGALVHAPNAASQIASIVGLLMFCVALASRGAAAVLFVFGSLASIAAIPVFRFDFITRDALEAANLPFS